MANYKCTKCGDQSGEWLCKPTRQVFKGSGYYFDLSVVLPYCQKCGSLIYRNDVEQEIKEKIHEVINGEIDKNNI